MKAKIILVGLFFVYTTNAIAASDIFSDVDTGVGDLLVSDQLARAMVLDFIKFNPVVNNAVEMAREVPAGEPVESLYYSQGTTFDLLDTEYSDLLMTVETSPQVKTSALFTATLAINSLYTGAILSSLLLIEEYITTGEIIVYLD